jgi:uncharacterized membrane protein YesL
MKDIFKKAFNLKRLQPLFVVIAILLLLNYVVLPGLTEANTFLNLISTALAGAIAVFVYTYVAEALKGK